MAVIMVLFDLKVSSINCRILLEVLLLTILCFCRLGSTLFVEIRMPDVGLQLFEFITLSAHLLNFTLAALVNNL